MRPLASPLLLIPAIVMMAAPIAHADKGDPAARSTARKLGQEALKLFDAGDYAAALDKLTTANQLVPTPTLGLYAARCLVKLGRLVEASERYLDVSRMPIDRGAQAVMRKAIIDAVAERDKLLPTIPTLEVQLDGPQGDGVTVVVDGQPLLPGLIGEKRPVDPGHHKATAKRGELEVTELADVEPGQAARIVLRLPPLPPPPPPPAAGVPAMRVAGWVGVSVGVAGAVVGAVSGIIALEDAQSLGASKSCANFVCGPAEAGTIATYHAARTLTTTGIVVGLAGFAFGIPVLLKTPKTGDGPGARPPGEAGRTGIEPWVSLGSAGVRGTF